MKKNTTEEKQSAILMYQPEDGKTRIEVRLESGNVWLTQNTIAELFQTTPQNITMHIKVIYDEGELLEEATCKNYLQVREEGSRRVKRQNIQRNRRTNRTSQRSGCLDAASKMTATVDPRE